MRYHKIKNETTITVNNSYEGESIENKIERIVTQNEPIKDGAPLIYTEREDGVKAEHDIRTDRWEIAIEAMDAVSKSTLAKREAKLKKEEVAVEEIKPVNTSDPVN